MDEGENSKKEKLTQILRNVKYRKIDKGSVVFRENDIDCREAFVIVKGEVAIIREPSKSSDPKPLPQVESTPNPVEPDGVAALKSLVKSRRQSISPGAAIKRNGVASPLLALQLAMAPEASVTKRPSNHEAHADIAFKEELFSGIDSGTIKLIKNLGDLMLRLQYGEIFGQFALISNSPRSASVVTLEETHVMVIHRREFEIIKGYFSSEFSDRRELLSTVLPNIELITDIKAFAKFLNSFEIVTLRKVAFSNRRMNS